MQATRVKTYVSQSADEAPHSGHNSLWYLRVKPYAHYYPRATHDPKEERARALVVTSAWIKVMPTWPQIAQPLCCLTPGFVEAERCGFDGKVGSTMGARRTWPLVFDLTCLSNNRGANVSLTSKDSLGFLLC